jgi:hypothetical protein
MTPEAQKGQGMRPGTLIENIEELRSREGIEDKELHEAICGLRVGDLVRVTLRTETMRAPVETVQVRLARIDGDGLQGRLIDRPASAGLSKLRSGTLITFARHHIHSLSPGWSTHAD